MNEEFAELGRRAVIIQLIKVEAAAYNGHYTEIEHYEAIKGGKSYRTTVYDPSGVPIRVFWDATRMEARKTATDEINRRTLQ